MMPFIEITYILICPSIKYFSIGIGIYAKGYSASPELDGGGQMVGSGKFYKDYFYVNNYKYTLK